MIRAVDPHDDGLLLAWYAVMRAGTPAGREAPAVVTYEALSTSLRTPNPRTRRASAFALRHGFDSAHQEDHLVLDLPVDPARVEILAAIAAPHHVECDLLT